MKKLRGKKRKKAHKKRLEKSLNVLFHPALKQTPIIHTKLKSPSNTQKNQSQSQPQHSLTYEYMSRFEKLNQSYSVQQLSDYVDIITVDHNIIAINKSPGILTARANDDTLDMQNILKSYMYKHRDFKDWKRFLVKSTFDKWSSIEPFVGVLHRLDKSTSGVTMYARHESAAKQMIQLFADRKVKKTYICVIKGEPPRKADDLEHYIAVTN